MFLPVGLVQVGAAQSSSYFFFFFSCRLLVVESTVYETNSFLSYNYLTNETRIKSTRKEIFQNFTFNFRFFEDATPFPLSELGRRPRFRFS